MMNRIFSTLAFIALAMTIGQARTLVVYYSFTNNVRTIVEDLQTQISCDVLEVKPAEEGLDYAANNYAIGSALIAAIRENPDSASSYPAIKTTIDNLDDYSTIIVATPLWWSNMAAPMQTFLFSYGSQMAGKHIGLIVSSHSSGISGVVSDAKRLIAEGDFYDSNLWIKSAQTTNCHSLLANWLDAIGYQDTLMGDINADGQITIGDVTALIAIILGDNTASISPDIADLNADGQITIGDVTALIALILSKQETLPLSFI